MFSLIADLAFETINIISNQPEVEIVNEKATNAAAYVVERAPDQVANAYGYMFNDKK